MIAALWIIAICEAIKVIQNTIQIMMTRHQTRLYAIATGKFIQMQKSEVEE